MWSALRIMTMPPLPMVLACDHRSHSSSECMPTVALTFKPSMHGRCGQTCGILICKLEIHQLPSGCGCVSKRDVLPGPPGPPRPSRSSRRSTSRRRRSAWTTSTSGTLCPIRSARASASSTGRCRSICALTRHRGTSQSRSELWRAVSSAGWVGCSAFLFFGWWERVLRVGGVMLCVMGGV